MFFSNDLELTVAAIILGNVGMIVSFIVSLVLLHGDGFPFWGAIIISFCSGLLGGIAVVGVLFMIQYTPYLLAMIVLAIFLGGILWLFLDSRGEKVTVWIMKELRKKK